jgi:hypothetical protein
MQAALGPESFPSVLTEDDKGLRGCSLKLEELDLKAREKPVKLLYTKASPFARKARATIIEHGLEAQVELVEITQLTIPTNFIAEISR